MDAENDMQFGHKGGDFWVNAVAGVGQAIRTRLLLFRGEWFLDLSDGMPWGGFPLSDAVVAQGMVLGKGTQQLRDMAVRNRVLGTPGVAGIANYSSATDPDTRAFSVNMTVSTIYGSAALALRSDVSGFTLGVTPLDGTGGL